MSEIAKDLSEYFRVGISPEYIEINPDLLKEVPKIGATEIVNLINQMIAENDRIFELDSGDKNVKAA